jgi:hypothetical protein
MIVRILLGLLTLKMSAIVSAAEGVEQVVVHHREEEFAGWPANEGMWSWGDEILVSFNVAAFSERGEKHSFTGRQRVGFSRSMDGGRTWAAESHDNVVVPALVKDAAEAPGDVDFSHPDFAMKIRGRYFHLSADRGRNWRGPFRLPDIGQRTDARTSYLVTGKSSCLFFIPCRVDDGRGGRIRSCTAATTDGGKTLRFLSWISPDPLDLAAEGTRPTGDDMSGTMPSVVRLDDGRLVCVLRNRIKSRKWSSVHESADGGETWRQIAELEKGATNPVALVRLGGERLAAIYGKRRGKPFGMSAKQSPDGGKTWGEEIMLRTDGRKWDLGYPRAIVRPDGTVVAAYYFSTEERPQQHIAATLWRP